MALGYARALSARGFTVTVVAGSDPADTAWAAPQASLEAPAGLPAGVSPAGAVVAPTGAFPDPSGHFVRLRVPITPYHGARWAIHAASARGVGTAAAAGFARILRVRQPDVVHVVDNVNLPLELAEVAREAGIPVVRTVSCAEDLCGLVAPVSPCSGPSGYCTAPLTPEHCAACITAAHPDLCADDPRDAPGAGLGGEPGAGPGAGLGGGAAGAGAAGGADPGEPERDRERAREHLRAVARLHRALQRKRARAVHQYTRVFDRVVFSNEAWRRYFEATLPLDPVRARTIPMGMDVGGWVDAAPRARPVGAGEPIVLAVAGTLDVVKGADALAAALSSPALTGRDDFVLRCLGGGEPERLAGIAASHPRVELRGGYRPEDLPGLLAEVDVGLSPSYFETFHRVTREYLLAGLPVVASRAFGVLDVVRDGVNGLAFDHAEPGSLARAIVTLLDDRARLTRLAAGARATAIRTVDEEADDLAALYEELIGAAPSEAAL
ncbi:MAG: hypothetical protein AMXMBFR46_00780 [Acidimicrobiia bacterium]